MKKFISWILLLCILSAYPAVAHADAENDRLTAYMKKQGFIDDSYNPELELTKSAMASLFSGFFDDSKDYVSMQLFSDVDKNTPNSYDINKAAANGIFAVSTPPSSFYPDEKVSCDDIAVKLVGMLGYSDIITKGDNVGKAHSLGLYKGTSTENTEMTNALIIIYNALDKKILESNFTSNLSYSISEDETLLSKTRNIYYFSGRINAVGKNALAKEYETGTDYVRIDEYKLRLSENMRVSAVLNLGAEVKAYYRETDDEYYLVHIELKKDRSVSFELADYGGIEDDKLKYEDKNGRIKTLNLSPYTYIVYNNRPVAQLPELGKYGTMKVISSDGRGYDVIIVKEYTDYVFGEYRQSQNLIMMKGTNTSIKLEDFEDILIYNGDGRSVELTQLVSSDVISVIENEDSIEIAVAQNSKNGTVEVVGNEDGRQYLTLNGVRYELSSEVNNEDAANTDSAALVGSSLTVYFNIFGRIAGYSLSGNSEQVGYLIWVKYDSDIDIVKAKIFNSIGQFETRGIRMKGKMIKIDDTQVGYEWFISENIDSATGKFIPRIVQYKVNSDGEITNIKGARSAAGECLYLKSELTQEKRYRAQVRSFSSYAMLKPDAKIFVVPNVENSWDNSKYRVVSPTFFTENSRYNGIKFYGTSKRDIAVPYAVYEQNSTSSEGDGIPIVITKITQSINADDEPIHIIEGIGYNDEYIQYVGGANVKLNETNLTAGTADMGKKVELAVGDVIRGKYSYADGTYQSVELFYDASDSEPWKPNAVSVDWFEGDSIRCGKVTAIYDGVMEVEQSDGSKVCYDIGNTKFYNVERNVKTGSVADIIPTVSRVVFYDNYARCRWVAIYN